MVSLLLFYGLMALGSPEAARVRLTSTEARPDHGISVRLQEAYGKLPLSFEPNRGQVDGRVRFLSRGNGYTVFLTGNEAVISLRNYRQESKVKGQKAHGQLTRESQKLTAHIADFPTPSSQPLAPVFLRVKLVGANSSPEVRGLEELSGKSNYFIGNNPSKWRTNLPTYAKVRYQSIYPGVDIVYYGNQGRLENDFIVAPGADPKTITLEIQTGNSTHEIRNSKFETRQSKSRHLKSKIASPLRIDARDHLVVPTDVGEVHFLKPVVYQMHSTVDPPAAKRLTVDGNQPASLSRSPNPESRTTKKFIDCRYVLKAGDQIGFRVGAYDPGKPLIIDPALSFSTFLGGSNGDTANGIAVDSSGNVYVAGGTESLNFPTRSPLQPASAGDTDAFVTKLNAAGTALVYSTYLGGSLFDQATAIAVNSSGNVYITGFTASTNFPTKAAFQTTYGGGNDDAFVAELKADGSALVYSSYLGGSDADFGQSIALDSAGNAYVTGSTQSTNFPTKGALKSQCGGYSVGPPASCPASDAFVAKVNPTGSALVYSTYLGGSAADSGQGIKVDASGYAYVTGFTHSADFPTASALQPHCGGYSAGPPPSCPASDAFVAKLNSAGSALVFSTYLGGSGADRGFAIAIDTSQNIYVTGDTESTTDFPIFPTTGALQPMNGGNGDAFVTKLNAAGSGLVYSTFLGGSDVEQGTGIAVDASNYAYVTGFTQSSNFPIHDALQPTLGGGSCGTVTCADAFLSKLDPLGTALIYSTYLGGSGSDSGQAITLDGAGNAYVAGSTTSPNFPATAGVIQAVYGGGTTGDAFVAKINPADVPAVALSPQKLAFGNQGMGAPSPPLTVTLTNAGSATLSISGLASSGDFALASPPSGSTLPACLPSGTVSIGGECLISVTFTPSALGARTGTLVIADDAAGSPQQVNLTGTGVAPAAAVTLSPTSLTFPDTPVGTTNATSLTATLTNSGSTTLTITKIAVSGDYTQTNTCIPSGGTSGSVAVGASCTITVTFTPKGSGNRTGSVAITDNAKGSPQTVGLSGMGIALFTLSADKSSTTITIGTASTPFTIFAATQSGFSSGITLSCVGVTGGSCTFNPTSIKPGGSSKMAVNGLSGSTPNPLSFSVNGTSGTQTSSLPLTIVFADFSLSASPPLEVIPAGQSTTYTVSVIPYNGFNQSVALKCSGGFVALPQGVTCSIAPSPVKPNGSAAATATVTVNTAARSLGGPGAGPWAIPPLGSKPFRGLCAVLGAWLLGFAIFSALAAGRDHRRDVSRPWGLGPEPTLRRLAPYARWKLRFGLSVILILVLLWAACAGGTVKIPGTPGGNYQLFITGTLGSGSSAVSRSNTVNLSVS